MMAVRQIGRNIQLTAGDDVVGDFLQLHRAEVDVGDDTDHDHSLSLEAELILLLGVPGQSAMTSCRRPTVVVVPVLHHHSERIFLVYFVQY